VVFLGEEFEAALAYPVQNAHVGGKATLSDYADYLNRASVGVSLMVSPHPSYPPLEMAEAGLLTITNDFLGKEMRKRCPEIVSLAGLNVEALAQAIEDGVEKMERFVGKITPRRSLIAPEAVSLPIAKPEMIADMIRTSVKALAS
jgi:hypothetical protein